jgi:RNA polymerase sigma-70 factor (ECF subfamily)
MQRGGPVEAAEFDQFYAAAAPRLVGQLTAMLGSFTEAQDCVQEAFVKAWLHRKELTVDGSPEAWVRRAAWRVGVSRWRSATAVLRAYGRRGADSDVPAPSEDHTALVAALRQINADQRRAIVLHHLCDLSVEEVALETDVPTGTVKARLKRGREALAGILGSESFPADPINDRTEGEASRHV